MIQQEPTNRYQSIDEIKMDLNRLGNLQLTRQKISRLDQSIIPETENDDPIIADPIKITNFDYSVDGIWKITLNQPVNDIWKKSLNQICMSYLPGYAPNNFKFNQNCASIKVNPSDAKEVYEYFESWLTPANKRYKGIVEEKNKRIKREEIKRAEDEKAAEEVRLKVLESLKN